jgi:hypothetical protein
MALSGSSLSSALRSSYLNAHPEAFGYLGTEKVFFWPGIPVAWSVVQPRLSWLGLGLALTIVATLLFDRFMQAPARLWSPFRKKPPLEMRPQMPMSVAMVVSLPPSPAISASQWTTALMVLSAEVKLTLRNKWWYWLGCGFLFIAAFLVDEAALRQFVVPLAIGLPVGIISDLGCRERLRGIHELIKCAPRLPEWYPIWKWVTGFLVSCMALAGPLVVLGLGSKISLAAALLVGIGFMVALAVVLGIWTNGYRLFVVVFVLLWWLLFSGIGESPPPWLDFTGLWYGGRYPSIIGLYLLITLIMIGLATSMSRWTIFKNKL